MSLSRAVLTQEEVRTKMSAFLSPESSRENSHDFFVTGFSTFEERGPSQIQRDLMEWSPKR